MPKFTVFPGQDQKKSGFQGRFLHKETKELILTNIESMRNIEVNRERVKKAESLSSLPIVLYEKPFTNLLNHYKNALNIHYSAGDTS